MLLWEPPAAIVEAGRIPRVLVVTLDVSHPYHAEFMHEVKLQHEWLEDAKTSLRQLLRETQGVKAVKGGDKAGDKSEIETLKFRLSILEQESP